MMRVTCIIATRLGLVQPFSSQSRSVRANVLDGLVVGD